VLLDLYGTTPVRNTAKGRQYTRPNPKLLRELQDAFDVLRETFLLGAGDVVLDPPQPLFYRYWHVRTGEALYQHAPLAWQLMKQSFVQVPRSVLRLRAHDVALALGMARVWRAHITTTVLVGPGHYRVTLRTLAEEIGEDWRAGARQEGRAYWTHLHKRLARIAHASELGTLHLQGEGPDAPVTLVPSEALEMVYRPLAEAAAHRQARAVACEDEVEVRATLAARNPSSRRKKSRPKT
jgi:hypothetical protein